MSAERFLDRLTTVFGDPVTEDLEGFVREYREALKAWSAEVLDEAASEVVRNHNGPHRWPRIKACLDACEKAAERRRAHEQRPENPETSDWNRREARARTLIPPAAARQAFEQGWFGGLWDFVRRHQRMPNRGEVDRVRSESLQNREAMTETIERPGEFGLFGKSLARLAAVMVERYEQRYRSIVGGDAP